MGAAAAVESSLASERIPIISEENGFWMVRLVTSVGQVLQEYRCGSEDVARAFAAMLISTRPPPRTHGAVARARPVHGRWWRGQ